MADIQEQIAHFKLDVRSHIKDSQLADFADEKFDSILRSIVEECCELIRGSEFGRVYADRISHHFAWLEK